MKIQQAMRCTQSQKEEIKSANVVVRALVNERSEEGVHGYDKLLANQI